LQARIQAEFAEDPPTQKWSPRARLALVLGSSTILWMVIVGAVILAL